MATNLAPQSEESPSRLHELLFTIRRVNQLIVEVDNELELLQRVCAALVGGRAYKMVWVGFVSEGSYAVAPVAQAGFEAGYLSSIKITRDDTEFRPEPCGTAIRTKQPSVMRNIATDERNSPWRQQALVRGYLSLAAFPLVIDDKVIGALNVYSGKPNAFDTAEIDMLVEVARDISLGIQKIRQREALRQSEERFRNTLDNMMEGCQIIGFDWRYLYVNDTVARHGRYAKAELLGHTMMEMYPGIEDTEMFGHLRSCMEKRIPHHMENLFTFPDGSQGWFQLSIEPVPEGIFILSWDITERRQAEEERQRVVQKLEATAKELEAFAYTISHDLRGPLHTVRSFAEALRANLEKGQKDRVAEDVQAIHSGIARMEHLLNSILRYSRSGTPIQPSENVPFGEIVKETLEQLASQISSVGASVTVAEDFPAVDADPMRLGEVLTNLILNSIDYRDSGRPLTIEIGHRRSDGELIFFVRDNGIGIAPTKADKIFELFYRGDSKSKGMGAGLAIVKRIVDAHGGRIWAEGELGKGTTICFTLPAAQAPDTTGGNTAIGMKAESSPDTKEDARRGE